MNKVIVNGREVDFVAAVSLMDDEIREDIHSTIEGTRDPAYPSVVCTNQEFVDAYCVAHAAKFGKDFVIS